MIKAVLLDLDNTLLRNPDEVFAPQYLTLAETFFVDYWKIKGLSRTLREIVGASNGQRDMQMTQTELAISIIAQSTGKSAEGIQEAFAILYETVYPQLRSCTEAVEIAPALVRALQEQGLRLIIATNPLYPAEAIRQRLAWAGLSDILNEYSLVTNGDNMHFTKSDPAYYAEVIARVGVEPDEAIMVGDSLTNDILPAQQIGLHTYRITEVTPSNAGADNRLSGTIDQFYHYIHQEDWTDTLLPPPLKPSMIEPELRGNVGALFGMLQDARPHYWNQHPDPEEWSPIQIICHLLESEGAVQRPRLQRIQAEDNPFISAPKQPLGPHDAIPCDEDGWKAARRFVVERTETIEWLNSLGEADWTRPARHSIFGPTTLLEMAHFTAQHDRLHLNQLCQTLGRCK